jgi:hypothetical protein
VDAHEERAAEIGERAIMRVGTALVGVLGPVDGGTYATAGVAEWRHGSVPSDLVREADRALLYGKQEGTRGGAILASTVPEGFMLGRALDDSQPEASPAGEWPSAVRRETEPLRKRTRQLALANALGARLAEMTGVDAIVEAVVDELERAFGYYVAAVVEGSNGGPPEVRALRGDRTATGTTDVVERCLIERQPVMGGARRGTPCCEAAVPIWVGPELWGVLDVQERASAVFEEADVRLLETIANQLGAALRSATLYEELERAYEETAEALGAALADRDANTAERARALVLNADRVGRRLGMSEDELRVLRYAAAFHDIGKIAVPDTILEKPGPLTEAERQELERHPLVGEQILQPVEFLERVRPIVRHCHERWDGSGYPDGLAGDRIPLGARVIQVCDAHDAMLRDRPYRTALPADAVFDEIRSFAGRQFDSKVTQAFIEAVGEREPAPA